MALVILGAGGQLGSEMSRRYPDAITFSHQELDISRYDSIARKLEHRHPDCLLNCAAYNQVDRAEEEPDAAWHGNSVGPRNLAHYCRDRQIPLIHISTDFVFGDSGKRKTPWTEADLPHPESVYATTKLAGEHFVLSAAEQHLVVRTCGLYGDGGKGNFVKTMLRLAREGRPLRVVDDQFCAPTSIHDLGEAIENLINEKARGCYHFVNQGDISWYQFARLIFEFAELDADLTPVTSREYAAPARRPAYSVLNCDKYRATTGAEIRSIKTALADYLK